MLKSSHLQTALRRTTERFEGGGKKTHKLVYRNVKNQISLIYYIIHPGDMKHNFYRTEACQKLYIANSGALYGITRRSKTKRCHLSGTKVSRSRSKALERGNSDWVKPRRVLPGLLQEPVSRGWGMRGAWAAPLPTEGKA